MKRIITIFAAMIMGAGVSLGFGADNNIQLNNSLRFEWDDNYYQAKTNKTSTGSIIESPEIVANYNRENTFLGLRYRPSVVWYTSPDVLYRETMQHELDANWNQALSPRISFTLGDIFRKGDQPQLMDRNNNLNFPNQSFIENSLNGSIGIQLRETTRLDLSGRYYDLNYDDAAVASNSNYKIYSGGLTLRQELSKATTVMGMVNFDSTNYKAQSIFDNRNSSTTSAGVGVDQIFSPRLLGSISGGWQYKGFTLSSINGQNSPYGNFSLTYLASPRLRITAGGGYSLWEADIQPYASQQRLSSFASIGYDITARLSLYISGGITRGKYLADQATSQKDVTMEGANQTSVTGQTAIDGVDTIYQGSARLSYQLMRHHWVDLGFSHTTLNSDLRPDFDVNIYDVGWRMTF